MKHVETSRRRRARRRFSVAALAVTMIASTLALLPGVVSATDKAGVVGSVVEDDGSGVGGVQADLYLAASPWQRADYVATASTDGSGSYSFDVGQGCYVVVVIAPLGAEFEFAGSGDMYDQLYGCASPAGPAEFRSVLYRDVKPPPPPPTTQPPTTEPPTTTTQPPPPPPPPPICAGQAVLQAQPIHHLNYFTYYNDITNNELKAAVGETVQKITAVDDSALDAVYDDFGLVVDDFYSKSRKNWYNYERYVAHKSGMASNQRLKAALREVPMIFTWIDADGNERQTAVKFCSQKTISHSPVALDLNGSGSVERIFGEFGFDFDADGETDLVSEWFAPTEGILFDATIAGEVSGAHLFGDQGGRYADGFEKLALLDANTDGQVAGAELAGLAIWTDANSNAAVDAGEMSSLGDHQVIALSTSHVNMVSEATLADGSTMMTEDLWFPTITPGVGTTTLVRSGFGLAAILGLLAAAGVAARRRRDGLDTELAELLERERAQR